jgi:hypothetical protein
VRESSRSYRKDVPVVTPKSQESAVRNNDTLLQQQNKWKMSSHRAFTQPGVSVPLSFNIFAVVNEFITRLPTLSGPGDDITLELHSFFFSNSSFLID